MTDRLFVYGTLAPGRPNAHVLADLAGTWHEATVAGALVEKGWGASLGYPALDLSGPDRVAGHVLVSDDLPDHWGRLDLFEGDGYERVTTEAELDDGSVVTVAVYVAAG